jgi:hypothetical protein
VALVFGILALISIIVMLPRVFASHASLGGLV